jgi:hypothetical protein
MRLGLCRLKFIHCQKYDFPEHRLAIQNPKLPKTRIELYELDQTEVNYTFNTLDAMAAKYPEHEFSWVIGSDNLAKFHLWGDKPGETSNIAAILLCFPAMVSISTYLSWNDPLPNLPEVAVLSTGQAICGHCKSFNWFCLASCGKLHSGSGISCRSALSSRTVSNLPAMPAVKYKVLSEMFDQQTDFRLF